MIPLTERMVVRYIEQPKIIIDPQSFGLLLRLIGKLIFSLTMPMTHLR